MATSTGASAESAAARYPRTLLRKIGNSESYVELYGEDVDNFQELKLTLASNESGITVTRPKVPLESFVGLCEIKWELLSYIEKSPVGLYPFSPDNGKFENTDRILLFGANGTGKTHLARAIATELEANLIEFKSYTNLFKWEFNLQTYTRAIYEISKDLGSKLSIVFLGNIHSCCDNDEQQKAVFHFVRDVQLEWQKNNVKAEKDAASRLVIMASSFKPSELEPDLVSLFDRKIYVPTLNFLERKELLEMTIQKKWKQGHKMNQKALDELARKLRGILSSEIAALVDRAISIQHPNLPPSPSKLALLQKALHDVVKFPLTSKDFEKASRVFLHLDSDTFATLETFQKEFGNGPFMKMDERENYVMLVDEDGEKKQRKWTWNVASWI